MRTPYSEAEAIEARQFVARYGPANAWTATAGTAARIIGRLLKERERLIQALAECRTVQDRDPSGGGPDTSGA
jgi:hypothetical protein